MFRAATMAYYILYTGLTVGLRVYATIFFKVDNFGHVGLL